MSLYEILNSNKQAAANPTKARPSKSDAILQLNFSPFNRTAPHPQNHTMRVALAAATHSKIFPYTARRTLPIINCMNILFWWMKLDDNYIHARIQTITSFDFVRLQRICFSPKNLPHCALYRETQTNCCLSKLSILLYLRAPPPYRTQKQTENQ